MMLKKTVTATTLTGVALLAAAGVAQASVMRVEVDQSLSDSPYTISLGDDSGFSFRSVNDGSGGYDLRLATRGDALTAGAELFGYEYIDKFATGDIISDASDSFIATSPTGTYADIPTTQNAATPFIGLSYLADGLRHFAYAGFEEFTDGFALSDYGYETVANQSIAAGTGTSPENEVPGPGSTLGLLMLTALGLAGAWRRRRQL